MEERIYNVKLFLYDEPEFDKDIEFFQNDTKTCILNINLYKDRKNPYIVNGNVSIQINKNDGTIVLDNLTKIDEGEYTYELPNNSINIVGSHVVTIQCNGIDNDRITFKSFKYKIKAEPKNREISSQTEYPILTRLIADNNNLKEEFTLSENSRILNENSRVVNEKSRQSNEVLRKENFNNAMQEYETYKNVMIAESNVAALQNQINTTNASLEQKANLIQVNNLETRMNNVIQSADLNPNKDQELVDARNGSATLGEEIRGKVGKIKLKNILNNSNFVSPITPWYHATSLSATPVFLNNEAIFTPTGQLGQLSQKLTVVASKKYYVGAWIKASLNGVRLAIFNQGTPNPIAYVSHSGSGNYEYLSFVVTLPQTINEVNIRIIDYSNSGWGEIRVKQAVTVDLTELFGVGKEPTKEHFESWLSSYNNGFYVNGTSVTNIINGVANEVTPELSNKIAENLTYDTLKYYPLYVRIKNDVLNVIFRYSDTKDMRIVMQKRGGNNIFEFYQFYLIDNLTNKLSNDITAGTLFLQNQSDWFGPHRVKAINNINGDMIDSNDVTGGNHTYDGGTGGSATGRTASIEFQVDGRKVVEYEGYCNNLDVYWNNRIQATNTKKTDGTGREVLSENINLHYDGYKINVDYNVETLESVTYSIIYGLQAYNKAWATRVFYHNSTNKKWNNANKVASDSGDKNCNRITLNTDIHYLDMALDSTIGLGKRDKIPSLTYSAHTTASDKTYLRLMYGDYTFGANEIETYRGYYRFYSKSI